MGLVTLPYVWVARELVPAAYLNADFNAILNQLNGNIDASNLAALAVTAAKIAVGAVTGPKIAMGGDVEGDMLWYDGTKYARVPAGTAGQVLTSGGTVGIPTFVPNTGGTWIAVQTGTPSTVANFTISNLVAGAKYKLIWDLTQNTTTGYLTVRLNGDSGSNYNWVWGIHNNNGASYSGGVNDTSINIYGYEPAATYSIFGDLEIWPLNSSNNISHMLFHSGGLYGSGISDIIGDAIYIGSSPTTSLTFLSSAGTMTGTWSLYQLS